MQRTASFHFPTFSLQPLSPSQKLSTTVAYNAELPLSIHTSNIAIYSRSTYKLRLSYGINAAFMRTATCLVDTRAGVNLVNPTILPSQWTSRIKRKKMSHLRTAAHEPPRLEGILLPHVHPCDLCV